VDRFPGVLDFVAALETFASSLPDARPSGRSSSAVLMQTDWKPPESPLRRRVVIGAVAVVAVAVLVLALRPVGARLLRGTRDRPQPAYVEPPPDSAVPLVRPADSAPTPAPAPKRAPAPLPPGREARRSQGNAPRPAPVAQARTEGARPRAAQREAAPAAPAAPAPAGADAGRLFVNASPWGQLYVDGQLMGNTPKANLSLAPGSHAVRVVREGYEPFERTIQVAAGQSVRLTGIVLVARP
jgi:hypothetical protein